MGDSSELCRSFSEFAVRVCVTLSEKIERTFGKRSRPTQVILDNRSLQLDADVKDALWFSGRDWHELTWGDWQDHSSAIFFFDPSSFAYYLPSILLLSHANPRDSLLVANSLISLLDRSPDTAEWTDDFANQFLILHPEELEVLKEWLIDVCEYVPYRRWGIAASGPGDTFGRAYETVDLLKTESERKHLADG